MTAMVTLAGVIDAYLELKQGESVIIGRSPSTDLVLRDGRVSRRHCRLEHEERGVVITDLRSANGTQVNGQVVRSALLRHGDRLNVGNAGLIEIRIGYTADEDYDSRTLTCEVCCRDLSVTTFARGEVLQLFDQFICPECRAGLKAANFSEMERKLIRRLNEEGLEVLERLPISGATTLYKARRIHLGQLVALKVLPLTRGVSKTAISRFAQEAKAQARLRHRNICTVFDVRLVREMVYIVMDLVEGESLRQSVERTGMPLEVSEALRVCYQIAQALDHAHGHGVIHRDVNPSTVILGPDGVARLIDFRLAKNMSDAVGITADGETLGTLGYMAPEQIRTAREADHRADLYGLGATLYHALGARPPSQAANQLALLRDLEEGPSLEPLVGVPQAVEDLVLRLLRPRPEERFASAAAVLSTIEAIVAEMTGLRVDAENIEFLLRRREDASDLGATARRPRPRIPSRTFFGAFQDAELAEFLQMLEFNEKTGRLEVRCAGQRGEMSVEEGRIVAARLDRWRGAQAVARILMQRHGEFEFHPDEVPAEHECEIRISQAVLNIARAVDESGRLPRIEG